jgi:hypothetical protein
MKIPLILSALVVIFLIVAPAAGNLNKIAGNVPVFIGESDIDISSSLNGCHNISWWGEGKNINSDPPWKNIAVVPINTASNEIYHFTFSPDVFTGYTGTWYCSDKAPDYPVFTLYEPNISISVWNLDNNLDVSGKSIPFGTNITYRIDTNLGPAANYLNRPNGNPADSFFTVSMTDPLNRPVNLLYTGSAGNPRTVILPLDVHPFFTVSPYYGKNMKDWSHSARNPQGGVIYPAGTYTIAVQANLNHMSDAYAVSGITDTTGKISDTKTVTLVQEAIVTSTPTVRQPTPGTTAITIPPTQTVPPTPPTTTPVPVKTTYSPFPVWVSLAAVFATGIAIISRGQ